MKKFFCLSIFFISCSSVNEESRPIKREARHLVKGGPTFYALDNRKDSNYQFILFSSNYFELLVFFNARNKYAYYAGTFRKDKDSLYLNFLKDYRPNHLTTKALINNTTQELILLAKDSSKNIFLKIVQSTLKELEIPFKNKL